MEVSIHIRLSASLNFVGLHFSQLTVTDSLAGKRAGANLALFSPTYPPLLPLSQANGRAYAVVVAVDAGDLGGIGIYMIGNASISLAGRHPQSTLHQ